MNQKERMLRNLPYKAWRDGFAGGLRHSAAPALRFRQQYLPGQSSGGFLIPQNVKTEHGGARRPRRLVLKGKNHDSSCDM